MRTEVTEENIGLLSYRNKVQFALFCVKQAIHLTDSHEAHKCVDVLELWLEGKASADECMNASVDANGSNKVHAIPNTHNNATAAYYVVNAAYYAAYATAIIPSSYTTYATYTAANHVVTAIDQVFDYSASVTRKQQEAYLYELIHINEIVEQTLLGRE